MAAVGRQATKAGANAPADALSERVESLRLAASDGVDSRHKASLGQYFTPAPIARRMASMLRYRGSSVHILDAGAGIGSLFAACVAELCARDTRPAGIHVVAYECDQRLAPYLAQTFRLCEELCGQHDMRFTGELRQGDFLRGAVDMLNGNVFSPAALVPFDCAILNPPYRKIQTQSEQRMLLRHLGIETSNLYSGFVAAAVRLLAQHGELVAITPRSFCNGPYFKSFRRFFLERMTLDQLHLFASRQETFRDDAILQENVILHATKQDVPPTNVLITTGTGSSLAPTTRRLTPYRQVIDPLDPELFIRIVADEDGAAITARMDALDHSLDQLGLAVSTGRVVAFRSRDSLRQDPEPGTVPLIYPAHFVGGRLCWPKPGMKKPNALIHDDRTQALLVPNERYVLVKRLSAKEEKRRVVAVVYDGARIPGSAVGFENHLNYFHREGGGLDLALARGLAAFLNSTLVDAYFRQFNGHTQVNATDLRSIRYPAAGQLRALGAGPDIEILSQDGLDTRIEQELNGS